MTTSLFVWGHEAAFLAYACFAAIVGLRGARTAQALLALLVMLATAIWTQCFVAVFLGYAPDWVERVAGVLRDGAWLALALQLMHRNAGKTIYFRSLAAATAAILVALQIARFGRQCPDGGYFCGRDAGPSPGPHDDDHSLVS